MWPVCRVLPDYLSGKTSVAKLCGEIYVRLGLLSKGDVVFKTASDFVGHAIGVSEQKTNAILSESEGCVLVIDEAYALHAKGGTDPYKTGVVDTLVEKVQNAPGEDRCVFLLGYREQMEEMLRDANPGLARRFPISAAFEFADYSDDELFQILSAAIERKSLSVDFSVRMAAVEHLAQQRRLPNFGNAGAAHNLLSQAVGRAQMRHDVSGALLLSDFVTPTPSLDKQIEAVFSDVIGCRSVLDELRRIGKFIRAKKARGEDFMGGLKLNYCFVGPPGTGQCTGARHLHLQARADVSLLTLLCCASLTALFVCCTPSFCFRSH